MKKVLLLVMAFVLTLGVGVVFAEESPEIDGCVDINNASEEELKQIIHIDEVRAPEIIELRPFSSIDDLTRVHGIAESRLADIKEEGVGCVQEEAGEDESAEEASATDEEEGGELPQTATNNPLFAMIGLAFVVLAGSTLYLRKRLFI